MEFWNLNLEGTNRVHISPSEPENISRPKKHHFYYLELKPFMISTQIQSSIQRDHFNMPSQFILSVDHTLFFIVYNRVGDLRGYIKDNQKGYSKREHNLNEELFTYVYLLCRIISPLYGF